MQRWRRPYPLDQFVMSGAVVFAFVGVIAAGTAVGLALGTLDWEPYFLLALPILAWSGRMALVGLYVGARGVRLRTMWRTQTLAWSEITSFESHPVLVLGGSNPSRLAIWIVRRKAPPIQTPLHLVTRSELNVWGPGLPGGLRLLPPAYEALLWTLRDRLVAAERTERARGAVGGGP